MAFVCSNCGLNFVDVAQLMAHYRYNHVFGPLVTYHCAQAGCVRLFGTLEGLRDHLLADHQNFVNEQEQLEDNEILIFDGDSDGDQGDILDDIPDGDQNNIEHDNYELVNEVIVTLEDFVNAVSSSALSFVAKLYSDPTLPRNHVQTMVDATNEFLSAGFVPLLKHKVSTCVTPEQLSELEGFFKILENPFIGLDTENCRFNAFTHDGNFIQPESFGAGMVRHGVAEESEGQFLPMRKVLKKFLEMPNVFNDITANMETLQMEKNEECIRDYLQGHMWDHVKKTHFDGKLVLPIFLHNDAYEPDNLNGSHSGDHALDAVYYTLPCIPKEHQATLKSMIIASLCLAKDKSSGNHVIYDRVLDELEFLSETGITVKIGNRDQQIYFCLGLVIGDNKGLHEILGFAGFNANYFCRFCKTHRNDTQTQIREDVATLRTVENYEQDVEIDNVEITGVNERCIFNGIAGYHCILNPSIDVMHDLLEGACKYGVAHVLYYFVVVRHYFSSEDFCQIVELFDYGKVDQNNKPSALKFSGDRIASRSINLSSSEMLFLMRHLGLMIGHLVPENDLVWMYFLKLQEILDFVMAPAFFLGWRAYLQVLIQEHHEMYLQLFNDPLKRKHHHMLHYHWTIALHGPPIHIWAMHCERKHRQSKIYARVCLNRMNLPYTIMIKHSLQLCQLFLTNEGFKRDILITGCEVVQLQQTFCYDRIAHLLDKAGDSMCSASVKSVTVFGTKYYSSSVILYGLENDKPMFGSIILFLIFDSEVYFVIRKLQTLYKNPHVNSYAVQETNEISVVNHANLLCYTSLHQRIFNDTSYVTPHYAL